MNTAARLAAVCGAVLALAGTSARAVQQAFLMQNSGWMEPFYSDPRSRLKPLVAAVAGAAAGPGDKVFILAFSQASGANPSPRLLGESVGGQDVLPLLAPVVPARKGEGGALADTDFEEAVTRTVTTVFRSRPGIIWIFTNNKNSPGNDPATAARNRDFYRLLHLEPSITRTVVFPLRMPVQGSLYQARGLMVYALAYGAPAGVELKRMLADGRLSALLGRAPALLKPVDQDAVRIVPQRVSNTPNVQASMGHDQRTVVLDVDADHLVPVVHLNARLQNMFFPYEIASARLEGRLHWARGSSALEVRPATVARLAPGASKLVEVRFRLPLEQVPSPWSRQAVAAMGKQIVLPMSVHLSLNNQRLALPDSFKAEVQALFPGDPISEVFVPPASVSGSLARVPLLVRVQYPLLPVVLMLGAVLVLLLAVLGLGLVSVRGARYRVTVDGVRRNIVLKPFRSLALSTQEGELVGHVRRGFGGPRVTDVQAGHTLNVA